MIRFREHLGVWWDALVNPGKAGRLVLDARAHRGFSLFLALGGAALYMLYGLTMGLFQGGFPAVVSGLKLPFLFLFTLAICLPGFYLLNCLVGPGLELGQCLRLLLIAVSANAAAIASYTPFSLFFTLTTSEKAYHFLVFMHVLAFGLAGFASIAEIGVVFRATAREMGKKLPALFVVLWALLYGFVGAQTSWVLRPWIGTPTIDYVPIRPISGSFVEAVWEVFGKVLR